MARKSPKSKRASLDHVTLPSMPKRTKHQKMMDAMHDALYNLSNKISPPSIPDTATTDLIPKSLQPSESNDLRKLAMSHVENLHRAFKSAGRGAKK